MEKLQSDASTPIQLDAHLQKVNGAIEAAVDNMSAGGGPGTDGSGGEDAFTDAVITTPVSGAASIFVSVADQMDGRKNPLTGDKRNGKSHFLGNSGYSEQNKPTPTPLVPMTYGEKKMAARRAGRAAVKKGARATGARGAGIFAADRLALASMSLTGGSMTDSKSVPIKGAKITTAMLLELGLISLANERETTLGKMQGVNRYDGNSGAMRLERDLQEGNAPAKSLLKNNPTMAMNVLGPK